MKRSLVISTSLLLALFVAYIILQKPTDSEEVPPTPVSETTDKPDFTAFEDVNEKKQAFFDHLRPSVEQENQRVLQEREQLLEVQKHLASDQPITTAQAEHMEALAEAYQLAIPEYGLNNEWFTEMLERVNVIPEALVLSQAANESAWGTSRFALEANNYFGQWCYSQGCGLIPKQRTDGATHEVAKFESAQGSVRAYFMNLNRNRAYAELRDIRAKLNESGDDLLTANTAKTLTQGLHRYSERGQDYITELQDMIEYNKRFWVS